MNKTLKKHIRPLWRTLPQGLRGKILALLLLIITRPIDLNRPLKKGDIIVCGLLGTASGLGVAAHSMLNFFQTHGLSALGANASRFALIEDFDAGPLWPLSTNHGGIVIFHLNPDIFPLVAKAIGHQRFDSRRIIGFWAWELENIPKQWCRCLSSVDEVWTHSHFTADIFRTIAPHKSIHVIPPFIDVSTVPTKPDIDPLPQFAGRPIIFFMYDVRSIHARKNPEGVIAAFRQATINNTEPVLIIKVNNAQVWPEAIRRLEQAITGTSNIHIMTKNLDNQGMKNLIARTDIVMSLHRSEGFGLLMAEAMAAAKPVIATGWSGNLDFMSPACTILIDYQLIPVVDPQHCYDKYHARWADPDITQAANALQRLLNDPDECQRMGAAARIHIADYLSEKSIMSHLPDSFWNAINS